jgi:hypothetical protein
VLANRVAEAVVELGVPHLLRQAGCTFERRLLVQEARSAVGEALVASGAIDRLICGADWPKVAASALGEAPELTLVAYPGEVFFAASSSWVLDACAELQQGRCDAVSSQQGPLERATRIVTRRSKHGSPPSLPHPEPRAFVVRTSALLKYLESTESRALSDGPASTWRTLAMRRRSHWSLTLAEALKSTSRSQPSDAGITALTALARELEAGHYTRAFTL